MYFPLMTRIPFAFARSALFRPANRDLEPMKNAHIPAAADYGITLTYSGPALTPAHALVWQAVVALAFQQDACKGVRDDVVLRDVDLLRACGRKSMQANAREWLDDHLADLTKAHVVVHSRCHTFNGYLLGHSEKPEGVKGRHRIAFDPDLAGFLAIEYVAVPMDSKARLIAHPLAAWAADYIATHQNIYRVRFDTLQSLTGSSLKSADFRKRFKAALRKIEPRKTLQRFSCEGGVLTLHKAPTKVFLPSRRLANAPAYQRKAERRIQQAREQRIKVAL